MPIGLLYFKDLGLRFALQENTLQLKYEAVGGTYIEEGRNKESVVSLVSMHDRMYRDG